MTVGGMRGSSRGQVRLGDARPDSAALGKLIDRYLPLVYSFVARRVDERSQAEELTARTLERALEAGLEEDLDMTALDGFLYRVAATAVVDRARRGRRAIPSHVRAGDLDAGDDRAVAEAMADEEATRLFAASIDRDRLRRAFVRLPDAQRRVIVLRYFDGLEADEMCAALACSRSALAVDLQEALRALQADLHRQASDAA
jgi:RNA polymerase sigma-70 factor, ECF subfamily